MPDEEAGAHQHDAETSALDRYLEHRERRGRFNREYVERLKQSLSTDVSPSAPTDPLWGHPMCDRCLKRSGCELQRSMRRVDAAVSERRVEVDSGAVDLTEQAPHEKVEGLAALLDASDARCMLAFGAKPQSALSRTQKTILDRARSSTSNDARVTLTDLLGTLRAMSDTSAETAEHAKRLISGQRRSAADTRHVIRDYESVIREIGGIEAKLCRQQMALLDDSEALEGLLAEIADLMAQLTVYVAAGLLKLDTLTKQLHHLHADATPLSNQFESRAADDCRRAIDRMSRRLDDLETTRAIAERTGTHMRLVQDNQERLAAQIHSTVLTTIPVLLGQIAITIEMAQQRLAFAESQDVADAANGLLREMYRRLKGERLVIGSTVGDDTIGVGTVQATAPDLIASVEDALRATCDDSSGQADSEGRDAAAHGRPDSITDASRVGADSL